MSDTGSPLPDRTTPDRPPLDRAVLFCLHFLGGSGREWRWVGQNLEGALRSVTIDLDGFGDAAGGTGHSVQEMADRVVSIVRDAAPARWLLAGHSMGAKVAAVVARRAEDGESGLEGLAGLVLLAGSPPGPEPMADDQRQTMLGWFAADAQTSRDEAEAYLAQNVGAPLEAGAAAQAVEDVLRTHRHAWTAWLTDGSREDWTARVGVLHTPTLIVAGANDAALGPEAQQAVAARHFAHARVVVLAGAGHLLPMERPDEVAYLIAEHAGCMPSLGAGVSQRVSEPWGRLLFSGRTSARTRAVLVARAASGTLASTLPSALPGELLEVLRALTARVLPQAGEPAIDLAAGLDALLAARVGDGWRYDLLPPDREAWMAGLRTLDRQARSLHGLGFAALDAARQDAILHGIAMAQSTAANEMEPALLNARQMQLWFEDVRADATRLYVSHPATLSRLGYSGTFYGGDSARPGFVRIGAGEREEWEPEPHPEHAA